VRFKTATGELDAAKMVLYSRTLETPRNVSVWWKGSVQLPTLKPFVYNYIALPGITDVIPGSGPYTGGTNLLVTGFGFIRELASDVRIKFGATGNNWMRGCILSERLLVVVAPPMGPSDSGLMDFDGACNDICPSGFEDGCSCNSIQDDSPECIRGIVRASLDPRNRASRRDRCPECELIIGAVPVAVSLNGEPPPPCRTKWTRLVPHPVLIGHATSLR